jgi:hypothetical protein
MIIYFYYVVLDIIYELNLSHELDIIYEFKLNCCWVVILSCDIVLH